MMKQFVCGLFLACFISAALAQTFPGAVTGIVATPKSAAVDLAWTAPTNNGGAAISSYKILYNVVGSLAIASASATDTTFTVTGLENNVNYAFRVFAVNAAGFETQTSATVTATPVLNINAGNAILQPTFADLPRRYNKQAYFKACFDTTANTNVAIAAATTEASSDACRAKCDADTTCKSYQFNEYGTKCTLFNAAPASSDLIDVDGTQCYVLIDACGADSVNTNVQPYLHASTQFKTNTFGFVLAVPSTYKSPTFTFVGGSSADCTGNADWAASNPTDAATDKCVKLYKKDVNWANMYSKCGASRSIDANFVIFRFNIRLDSSQDIYGNTGAEEQEFSVSRAVSHTLPLIVKFPRLIDVTASGVNVTNVLEGGKIPGQAALISTVVNATGTRNDVTLDIEILTVVTYPDFINAPSVVTRPDSLSGDIGTSFIHTNDCEDAPGRVCKQYWHIRITNPAADRCDFNGAYKIHFPYKCKASYTGGACPEDSMDITFNIKTLDHCPKITTADLKASMATYLDKQFSTKTVSYKLRDIVYAHFETTSDTASIKSTTLKNIVMRQPGYDDIPMWNNFESTTNGTSALCKVWNSDSTVYTLTSMQARFSCKLLPAQVILPSMARRTITWYALAEVVFENTAADGTKITTRRLLEAKFNHREIAQQDMSHDEAAALALTSVASDDFSENVESMTVEAAASSASFSAPSMIFSLVAIVASFFAMMF